MAQKSNVKTLAIKARLANTIRKLIYPYVKGGKTLSELTESELSALGSTAFEVGKAMHQELNAYKAKRKFKASVAQEREKRGYKRKQKTSKAEWEAKQQKELVES